MLLLGVAPGREMAVADGGSSRQGIVADGTPALDEIVFFAEAGGGMLGVVVDMEMGRAIGEGIAPGDVAFEALMQIAALGNVDRAPVAIGQLLGVEVNSGPGFEDRGGGMNLEGIFRAGLTGPKIGAGLARWRSVMPEQVLQKAGRRIN